MDWSAKIALVLYFLFGLNLALQKGLINSSSGADLMTRVNARSTLSTLGSLAAWTLILAVLFTIIWIVRL